jgi:glutamyl-tRNA reductase
MVIGATYREMDTDARERLSDRLAPRDPLFAEQLVLHTCHRVEKIGLLADGQDPELPEQVRAYAGAAAVERVFLVAGGFDSAVVGEEQILGQVRDAYHNAQDDGTSGPVLNELMRRAIRFGKHVRSETRPVGDRSLADRAGQWLVDRIAASPEPNALVIGTGEMGRLLAAKLASAGVAVTVASRHLERATELAITLPDPGRHGATLLPEVLARRLDFAGVAIALRGGTTPIGVQQLPADGYVVDLSAPRTVTAEAALILGDRLLDLDGLDAGEGASILSPGAERRLREEARREAQRFTTWIELRSSGDGISLLRHQADEVRRRHVVRLTGRAGLSDEQAAEVDAMTRALVGELLHVPTVQLGRSPDAAALVREVFGID